MASDLFRKILKHSIVFLFTLAVFFFLLIFLLSAAYNHQRDNTIDDTVPIQQDQLATWGKIPGALNFASSQKFNLYSFDYNITEVAADVPLTKSDDMDYDVARDFVGVHWYPQKSVVAYNMSYDYTETPASEQKKQNAADDYFYPNLGAVDVWTQMTTDMPKFMQAWQALTQASTTIFETQLLNRFYAINAYYYMFEDYAQVQKYVLAGLSETEQNTVYTDPNYGMNSIKGLTWWVSAAEHGADTDDWNELIAYYKTLGIDLDTTGVIAQACGNGSMIQQIVNQLTQAVRTDPLLDQHDADINVIQVSQAQWGFCGVIYDSMIVGLPKIYSMASIDEVLPFPPEFGAYVLDPDRGNGTQAQAFNISRSKVLLDQDPTSFSTFLNSENMRYFYEEYALDSTTSLMARFGFDNDAQIHMFHDYLDEMIDNYLFQNSTVENIAMGTLLYKQLNMTFGYLQSTLPITVATRVMASNLAASGNDCAYYVSQSTTPDEKTNQICAAMDFTDPASLQLFINATWYGGDYLTNMLVETGFSELNWAYFWNPSSPNSFGALFMQGLAEESTQFGCGDATNCTASEIAGLQWGSQGVTNNPATTWSATYLPKSPTVAMWGTEWAPYNELTRNPEFPYYSQDASALTIDMATAMKVGSANDTFYGLGSKLMSQSLMIAYFNDDTDMLAEFQNWYGATFNLDNFIISSRKDIQNRIFGDVYIHYTADELLHGFYNEAADNINGGAYYNGDMFSLRNFSTPILHNTKGSLVYTSYGMYTGSVGQTEIGQLRLMNDVAYVNRVEQIWDGQNYVNISVSRPSNGTLSNIVFEKVSYGMQFPPGMNQDPIKAFNAHSLDIDTYKYDSEDKIGSKDLSLYKFTKSSFGGDLKFSASAPIYEEAYGCYGCDRLGTEDRVLKINGVATAPSTTPADNFIKVQPNSGYTYEVKKDATSYFILGGKQTDIPYSKIVTPFPDLDPIYGLAVPLYDSQLHVTAGEEAYTAKLDYIAIEKTKVRNIIITMSVFAAFCLILAIVALVLHKLMDDKEKNRDELLERHMDDKDVY